MTLDQIDVDAQQIDHGVYATQKIPNPHSSFKRYSLVIGPTAGLCKVKAISKSISTDSSGDQLRQEFEKTRERLEKIYGKGETKDYIESESIWKDPGDFMTSLQAKDRVLVTIWKHQDASELKAHVASVFLKALPMRSDRGLLVVEYEFAGFEDCVEEINQRDEISLSSLY